MAEKHFYFSLGFSIEKIFQFYIIMKEKKLADFLPF